MNFGSAFITDAKAPKLVQPRNRAFHDPARFAEAAAVLGVAARDLGRDAACGQGMAVRIGIVSPVGLNEGGFRARTSRLSGDRRHGLDQRQKLRDVVSVGLREDDAQRNALGIREEVVFRARTAAIGWVRSSFFPAPTARMEEESAIAREKSILSAPRSWESSARCSRSQTPASCQACSLRQQVMPLPQPISFGSISQGIPERRTKRMPVSAWRSEIGLRPGYRFRRRLGGGNRGSIIFHNRSSTKGRGIRGLLAVQGDTTKCRTDFSFC